jgi:hypothetical protein
MRTRLLFTLGLLALSCGGGAAKEIPEADACPEAAAAICGKVFSCPASDLVLGAVQLSLGGSDANCQATIKQNYCGSLTCTNGQTYHGDKAYQCKEQFKGVACSDIAGALIISQGNIPVLIGTLAPACGQVCTN